MNKLIIIILLALTACHTPPATLQARSCHDLWIAMEQHNITNLEEITKEEQTNCFE